MAGISSLLLHSAPSQTNSSSKFSNIKTANFTQIPSWVSLKPNNSFPLKTSQTHQGKLENLHLISLSKQGKSKQALQFLNDLDQAGVSVTTQAYESLLEMCARLKLLNDGKLIHQRIRKTVENPPGFLQNCVLGMYCDCGCFSDAEKLFDEMHETSLASWVIIISAYADEGLLKKALDLFLKMQGSGFNVGPSVYISLLRCLYNRWHLELGKQLHCHVIKRGSSDNVSMGTAVSSMYAKCGCLDSAEKGFDRMEERTAVTWTVLMVGYTQNQKQKDALRLFERLVREDVELDEFVFSITLKACAGLEELKMGQQVHGLIVKLGLENSVSVGTPLVDFYVKCKHVELASQAFEQISEPNDVSWSAIICGYCQTREFERCFKIFKSLRSEGSMLNEFICTNIFQACSALADFSLGAQAHGDAIKRGLVSYVHGESAMVTMYAKCGRLDYAHQAFESICEPDTVAWTAIIAGCAYHGNGSEALDLFERMRASGVRANEVTFIALFTACSHCGLINQAKQYLESMRNTYGLEPTIDHYDCMIDIYARAGLLSEALQLIEMMPFEPDAMSWKSLLGGCSIHWNFELGKLAAEKLLQLDPEDTAAYILMFNLHASCGKWDEAARVRRMMAERNLKKEVGCSWISVRGEVHQFTVGDRHHPRTDEIYAKLEELEHPNRGKKNALLTEDERLNSLPERKEQLLDHSERLAIAFGLISTSNSSSIVVFKNLRACKDCHEFAKRASEVTGREIVVRDSNRFHHFKFGKCSCGDYW